MDDGLGRPGGELTNHDLRALVEERTAWARRTAADLERIRQSRPVRLYGRLITLPGVGPLLRRVAGFGSLPSSAPVGAASPARGETAPEPGVVRRPPLALDAPVRVDEHAYVVSGRLPAADAPPAQLLLSSPEGNQIDLTASATCWQAPADAERPAAGFVAWVQIPEPSRRATGWSLVMRRSDGGVLTARAPAVVDDPLRARDQILAALARTRPPSAHPVCDHVFAALERAQAQLQTAPEVERVIQFGDAPAAPAVSLVIPLYRRVDFLEYQLAQFAHDPDLARADLIYVLDSPELAPALVEQAALLSGLYRLSLRLVILRRNSGYSAANNAGVDHARGRWLVLLNSDVLPARPGWLTAMIEAGEATPNLGALGPKLLYEDDSLQHAGMYFHRREGEAVWLNEHYFKGLHRDLPAANVCRHVPAVTGACLLIERDLYRQLGGLRGLFMQGDFEDSDLCLRAAETGRDIWYLPAVELYHLEGQSYPTPQRQLVLAYNAWLHTRLWRDRLAAAEAMAGPLDHGRAGG
ncbi:MAG: glycosyltransferase family 2 protein [Chloroflexi bacterium]|nr:glycosyltransferase family 2 protein [Chloroflexota bacterium]